MVYHRIPRPCRRSPRVSRNGATLRTNAIRAAPANCCATVPKPLQGEVNPITPREAQRANAVGATVRWGGRIVSTEPGPNQTCFEMIGSTLQSSGRPADMSEDGSGRFIACKSGFYDPAIFLKDRELTVLGRIDGYESRKIGDYDYRQPRVAADVVYLWPKAR